MNAVETASHASEFNLTSGQFQRIRALVLKLTGIHLTEEKRQLAYGRYAKRLRALNLNNFDDYLCLVEQEDSAELDHFISAITTNFTGFFREPHHFEFLKQHVKELLAKKSQLRIWSAGCSTGEEPYTIAMTLLEAVPNIGRYDCKILATDLDKKVLATAAEGRYPLEKLQNLPLEVKRRGFVKGSGANAGFVKVRSEVANLIHFRQLNLLHDWPMKAAFDVIFCRNVVIYFDKEVQKKLFKKFSQRQVSGAHLVIGHSENLANVSDDYRIVGRTIYQKK
ncbi:protein-glutamate O-methyltransferase CheR [Spongiibacter taiwanensis]|uniref:CheR family methyltransferase n=1 Tax=Spongiibacter taiwanensis TaxID=1748242 RepID=UPI0020357270|nr:protein-glutamate O-methyltransferase CheR [Spongiibacter taiwanensis]USA42764.1 protein-glutamate O-methyltransferase CheR [Spongiibacter taiwanensis]